MNPAATAAPAKYRARLMTIAGLLLILIGMISIIGRVQDQFDALSDFSQDYLSAQALRVGQSIYSDFTEFPIKAGDATGTIFKQPVKSFHPPFNAILFVPLTFLSYNTAFLLWTILSVLLYLAMLALLRHEFQIDLPRHWLLLLVGLALCWRPFLVQIHLGQLSIYLISCIIGCWALLRHGRPLLAGALLGLASLIKLFPGLLIACLLLIGLRNLLRQNNHAARSPRSWKLPPLADALRETHWRAAASAIVVLALGHLLGFWIVGQADMLRYSREIVPQNIVDWASWPANLSITGIVSRLLVDSQWVRPLIDAPQLASWIISTLNLLVLSLLFYQVWRLPAGKDGDSIAFALTCLAMLIISPISWQHMFPLLFFHFGLLYQRLHQQYDRTMMVWILGMLFLVSLPSNLMRGLLVALYPDRVPWYSVLVMILPTAGLVLLWWLVSRTAAYQSVAAVSQPQTAASS